MNPRVVTLLNQQINHEFFSYFVYQALAVCFERLGLFGFEKWAQQSAAEELGHAHKLIGYLQDRMQPVEFYALEAPATDCQTLKEGLAAALTHEQQVTGWIHEIVAATTSERDYTTFAFIQMLVLEQIEEEKKVADLLARVNIAGDEVILVDHELLDEVIHGLTQPA